jgi:hypothetical protein
MPYIILPTNEHVFFDEEDAALVSKYSWSRYQRKHTIYAKTSVWNPNTKKRDTLYLHRVLMDASPEVFIDHKDGNGLNCRRGNLRAASRSNNAHNSKPRKGSSPYKGVHWTKCFRRWDSQITFSGTRIHVGSFKTDREAAIAYNIAALKYHGEFARLNDIQGPETALHFPLDPS